VNLNDAVNQVLQPAQMADKNSEAISNSGIAFPASRRDFRNLEAVIAPVGSE